MNYKYNRELKYDLSKLIPYLWRQIHNIKRPSLLKQHSFHFWDDWESNFMEEVKLAKTILFEKRQSKVSGSCPKGIWQTNIYSRKSTKIRWEQQVCGISTATSTLPLHSRSASQKLHSTCVWPRNQGSLTPQLLTKAYISHQEGLATSNSHSPNSKLKRLSSWWVCCRNQYSRTPAPHWESWRTQVY